MQIDLFGQNFYLIGTIEFISLESLLHILVFFCPLFMHVPSCLDNTKMNFKSINEQFHLVYLSHIVI